jgi:hypothetical protein
MPVTAGVIDFIGGIAQLGLFIFWFYILVDAIISYGGHIPADPGPVVFCAIITAPFALLGIIAIMGGIFTLKRKRWKLALAGSFLAFLPAVVTLICLIGWDIEFYTEYIVESVLLVLIPLILGITAPVLTILSRKQFEGK